jgi:hypothetical protein
MTERRSIPISFTIDPVGDVDIKHWLDGLPDGHRSEAIRQAIRSHIAQQTTLSDVLRAVQRLERKIEAGAVAVEDSKAEPDEAVAALTALANL